MTTTVTVPVAQALHRIKMSPEFADLRGFLRQLHADSLELLQSIQDERQLRQEQGRAQALRDLLERIENSNTTLARLDPRK
jgi:hypothetical protein